MILRTSTWERIRDDFSEAEKKELNGAVTGESVCPRGFVINEKHLSFVLRVKLNGALMQEAKSAHTS